MFTFGDISGWFTAAPLNLSGNDIVEKPNGWRSYQEAKSDLRTLLCADTTQCDAFGNLDPDEFQTRLFAARQNAYSTLGPSRVPTSLNFSRANLADVFWPAADIFRAKMNGADLRLAQMEGANLSGAQMEGANLSLSHLVGLTDRPISLVNANLTAATNDAGVLRFVDMTGAMWDNRTDFRGAFLDGSVLLPDGFFERMGRPCQWVLNAELNDAEFYSLWRWWVQKTGNDWLLRSPPPYLDVPDATPELLAKYNLTDCKPGQDFGPMPDDG